MTVISGLKRADATVTVKLRRPNKLLHKIIKNILEKAILSADATELIEKLHTSTYDKQATTEKQRS